MARPRARRDHGANVVIERHEAGGVALLLHQVGERRGKRAAVLQLREAAGAVAHRPADIEQQIPLQVRVFLVHAHDEAVAPREHLPVDRGEVVPWAGTAGTRRTPPRSP